MRSLSAAGLDVQAVLGNHEAGFLRWLRNGQLRRQKAKSTRHRIQIESYKKWLSSFSSDEIAWLKERPLHAALPLEFGDIRVVHAGMHPSVSVAEQQKNVMLTIRSLLPNGTATSVGGSSSWAESWRGPTHLIFGHDARRQVKVKVYPHATGIDSGCVYGGRLSALILHHKNSTADERAKVKAKGPSAASHRLRKYACIQACVYGCAYMLHSIPVYNMPHVQHAPCPCTTCPMSMYNMSMSMCMHASYPTITLTLALTPNTLKP